MAEFAIFVVIMIVLSVIGKLKQQSTKSTGTPSPRVQKLIERIQAQQGTAPGSQQVAAALEQSMQAGRQPRHLGERTSPGQSNQLPAKSAPQYQPAEIWLPANQPPAHRPPQNNLPAPKQDLDARVRELMRTGHEVGAIRLLCDERDLGILDAQTYARALVAPTGTTPGSPQSADAEPDEDESRYVGSAAFAESIFDLDREENVWASGWVDTDEPDDRSDIDELWQTVRNPPRPGVTPAS
ncbi:hypothetical protein [Kribbella sp. NBC_00359]|uniref:hypothetical protein n=1 Tax=Kribbella sp. NBC_00359 TaxID=2975966 RepID=UPI002E1E8805